MISKESKTDIFKLKHYFALIGLASTIIAAFFLVLLYRHMAIGDIITLGERNNLILAQTVMSSVKSELVDYLSSETDINNNSSNKGKPLSARLNSAMQDVMTHSSVIKINIINKEGIIIFSTQPSQIGVIESDNEQFKTAIDGHLASRLIFNDSFSFLRKSSEDDNLVQTYLPVRATPVDSVHGVFEIYSDVNPVVDQVERTEAIAFFGVFIILFLLYSFLVLIVRIASNTIEKQQSIIQERTRTLEILSSQMLNAHETEKKRLALKLHEGLAQTLAAIKNTTELVYAKLHKHHAADDLLYLQQNIHAIQDAIQEVRSLTMELRPPSLDDFGLIKTIEWFCNEYQSIYPDVTIRTTFDIDDSNLPASLRILLYRIIQEVLGGIGRIEMADEIQLSLTGTPHSITLSIEDNALPYHANGTVSDQIASQSALAVMKERTLLSGGSFTIESTRHGGTLARSTWSS